ncbi:transposase [Bacillus sp. MB2021]|uniref:transposase n=1 Tax=Bacillus sp. MB2021 TaxID=1408303 RepID=UPI0018CC15C8|nr:transposase [Bacillus sp. MB2021]
MFLPFVGLDDLALRKGHTYGMLIFNLKTHQPIALLPDRRPETVTSWLQKYPAIQMVSRDGFTGFRQGITEANPSIKHIYDRWHFITNAKKQLDSTLSSIVPSTILWWEKTTQISADTFLETRTEQRKRNRKETKWELIQEIQKSIILERTFRGCLESTIWIDERFKDERASIRKKD